MLDNAGFIGKLFREQGCPVKSRVLALDGNEKEQEEALRFAQNANRVIFFCFDPHLYPATQKLLHALESRIEKLAVVFLRDPFGADFLTKKTPYLYTFGFRRVQIAAAVECLYAHEKITAS